MQYHPVLLGKLKVELVDGELLITRVVGAERFLMEILLVWLPGSKLRELSPSTHKSCESDSESLSVLGGKTGLLSAVKAWVNTLASLNMHN